MFTKKTPCRKPFSESPKASLKYCHKESISQESISISSYFYLGEIRASGVVVNMCGMILLLARVLKRDLLFKQHLQLLAELLFLLFLELCPLPFVSNLHHLCSTFYHFSVTGLDATVLNINVYLLFFPHKLKNRKL